MGLDCKVTLYYIIGEGGLDYMEIKDLVDNLGIPRANIRFYEKEGLLNPQRKENQYRDYSEEDIDRLKKIIILRKLGITISEIKAILDKRYRFMKFWKVIYLN